MKIGQISFSKLSNASDYLQLDICGCNTEESLTKFLSYNKNIPIILHGDWTKKGFSENNLDIRYKDYIKIINSLKKYTKILGLTLHPPKRTKMNIEKVNDIISIIKNETNFNSIFLENRSNKLINLSTPQEIIEYSFKDNFYLTIDIPQLYISCNYNEQLLYETLSKINMNNVKEVHLANIKRDKKHTYVGRKLFDGDLDIKKILKYFPLDIYYTLEILGQIKVYEDMKNTLIELKKENL